MDENEFDEFEDFGDFDDFDDEHDHDGPDPEMEHEPDPAPIIQKETADKKKREHTPMRYHTERAAKQYEKRRFFSETNLLNEFEWHLEDGNIYCVITGGDVDSLSFLKHVIRQQPLDYCLLSSWCFGIEDVQEIRKWTEKKLIKRIDFYMGEIARASYAMCTKDLSDIAKSTGGRAGVFRNHSKVILCYGPAFSCAIVSSANINTNPRTENTTIICNKDVCDFYKSFFDDINPFNYKDFPDWKPYDTNGGE